MTEIVFSATSTAYLDQRLDWLTGLVFLLLLVAVVDFVRRIFYVETRYRNR